MLGAWGRRVPSACPLRGGSRDRRRVRSRSSELDCSSLPQAHGQTFTFPDLFPEKEQSPDGSPGDEDIQDKLLEEQQRRQSRDPRRGGVPDWFGL